MKGKKYASLTDQVTDRLRSGMLEGCWQQTLPGRHRLAEELCCSHRTIEAAMRRLTQEGMLVSQGAGRKSRIVLPKGKIKPRGLRIRILAYDDGDFRSSFLLDLMHRLQDSGNEPGFADKTLLQMNMDLARISRLVRGSDVDGWILMAAPRHVLEWFSQQSVPVFALFGQGQEVPIASAGVNKKVAISELLDRLFAHGHRRIVYLVREEKRKPSLGPVPRIFFEKLDSHGIKTGTYNLPEWEETPDGVRRLLDSLFQHTPPTAILLDLPVLLHVLRDYLAQIGKLAPRDISLACCDVDRSFNWCQPVVTHIEWDVKPILKHAMDWASNIYRGIDDRRKVVSLAKLVTGGTIGPVPDARRKI